MPNIQNKLDRTGRTLLDHVADIGANAPEKCHETHQAFIQLYQAGWGYTSWSIDAAIRSNNHRLLRWLMETSHTLAQVELSKDQMTCVGIYSWRRFNVIPADQYLRAVLDVDKLTWCAVHSRNRFALRWCRLTSEHFDQVAQGGDTAFLGAMLQSHRQLERDPLERDPLALISVRPFLTLLDEYDTQEDLQHDTVERARLGFRWLLRNRMIDLDTVNIYHQEQIVAIYGDRVRLLLSP